LNRAGLAGQGEEREEDAKGEKKKERSREPIAVSVVISHCVLEIPLSLTPLQTTHLGKREKGEGRRRGKKGGKKEKKEEEDMTDRVLLEPDGRSVHRRNGCLIFPSPPPHPRRAQPGTPRDGKKEGEKRSRKKKKGGGKRKGEKEQRNANRQPPVY